MWKNGAAIIYDKWKERGLEQNNFLQWYALISICTEKDCLSLQTCSSKTINNHITNIKVSMTNWDPKISIHLKEEVKLIMKNIFSYHERLCLMINFLLFTINFLIIY